jgi:hypothetical protein
LFEVRRFDFGRRGCVWIDNPGSGLYSFLRFFVVLGERPKMSGHPMGIVLEISPIDYTRIILPGYSSVLHARAVIPTGNVKQKNRYSLLPGLYDNALSYAGSPGHRLSC